MTTPLPTNGSKLAYFVISTLIALLMALGTAWAHAQSDRISAAEARISVLERNYSEILRGIGRIEGRLDSKAGQENR